MHLARLINALSNSKYEKHLALARSGGAYEQLINNTVIVHHLTKIHRSSTLSLIYSIIALKRLIHRLQPTLIVSIMEHANFTAIIANKLAKGISKNICLVQTSPKHALRINGGFSKRVINFLIPLFYTKAISIISLSKGVETELRKDFKVVSKITTIHNIASTANLQRKFKPKTIQGKVTLISVGRLIPLKGFEYLILAMNKVRREFKVELLIFGEGPYQKALENLIISNNLGEIVKLRGYTNDIVHYMEKSDLFVLSSLYEGFGNVIVEAMDESLPVIATDCPYGPGEIIEDGINGWLIPPKNTHALASKLLEVLGDNNKMQKVAENGFYRASAFTPNKISQQYECVFDALSLK